MRPRRTGWLVLMSLLGCNEGLGPRPSPTTCPRGFVGICGTVTFRGDVPDSTAAVYIVAYAKFPTTQDDLFTFLPFPSPPELPLDSVATSRHQFYTVPLPDGDYAWVLAAWLKIGTFNPTTADSLLREAGYYRDPADTSRPGSVRVHGTGTDSIDFVVDFTNMHAVSYYFPAVRSRP